MKFKDMPYKRVDYDKTAEQFKTLTKRVKEAKSGEELWEIHQEYYKVYQNMMDYRPDAGGKRVDDSVQ